MQRTPESSDATALAVYTAAREGLAHRVRPAGVVDVTGEERETFLQGQLTQEMRDFPAGTSRDAAGLTPKGKLLFVARVVALTDRLRLIVPELLRLSVLEHLRKYAVFTKVAIEDRSAEFVRIGLLGPRGPAAPAPADAVRLPADGEHSAELLVPAAARESAERLLGDAGSVALPDAIAEILRLEAGRPRFGTDMDGTNLPDEVGLAAAISTTKGCYVGQEVVARLRTYGRVNRRLVRFRFEGGPIEPGTALRRPEEKTPSGVEAGRVTSSAVSPALGSIGLGFAFREVAGGNRLTSVRNAGDVAVVSEISTA